MERLHAAVLRYAPAVLYLVPDFQNPVGVTLSLAKRQMIIELAERYNFRVIEDVCYRKLRYRGTELPLLRDLDPRHVITLGSYSKVLSPGLRVGYVIAPAGQIKALARVAEATYLAPVLPTQATVAEYIQRGWFESHLEHLRTLYRPRLEAVLQMTRRYLAGVNVSAPDGGFFVSLMIPPEAAIDLEARAREQGVVLEPDWPFFANPDRFDAPRFPRLIRLPFCALPPEHIDERVRRLAALL